MAIKPVKNIISTYGGAPTLNGIAGAGIGLLDAFLVNGFNLGTLSSLSVSGGILTGNRTAHGYSVNQVIETSGANESALNSQWTVTTASANSFSADATGIADTTGTGTISCKAAPLGWEKVYSGTNKAVYRSQNVAGTRLYLRVDDTGAREMRLIGYEVMTDVDTGTGLFPTTAQLSGGVYWRKSASSDATARAYVLVGDSRGFFANLRWAAGVAASAFEYFGDFPSEKVGDAYACALTGQITSENWLPTTVFSGNANANNCYLARSFTQVGSAVAAGVVQNVFGLSGVGVLTYPAPTNNGLILGKCYKMEGTTALRCAQWPGVYATPQAQPLTHLDLVTGIPELPGRTLITIAADSSSVNANIRLFVDLTGPWR